MVLVERGRDGIRLGLVAAKGVRRMWGAGRGNTKSTRPAAVPCRHACLLPCSLPCACVSGLADGLAVGDHSGQHVAIAQWRFRISCRNFLHGRRQPASVIVAIAQFAGQTRRENGHGDHQAVQARRRTRGPGRIGVQGITSARSGFRSTERPYRVVPGRGVRGRFPAEDQDRDRHPQDRLERVVGPADSANSGKIGDGKIFVGNSTMSCAFAPGAGL